MPRGAWLALGALVAALLATLAATGPWATPVAIAGSAAAPVAVVRLVTVFLMISVRCTGGSMTPMMPPPITTIRNTSEGMVQFQATVTFPAPGMLEYAEGGNVRRALFLPELWRFR